MFSHSALLLLLSLACTLTPFAQATDNGATVYTATITPIAGGVDTDVAGTVVVMATVIGDSGDSEDSLDDGDEDSVDGEEDGDEESEDGEEEGEDSEDDDFVSTVISYGGFLTGVEANLGASTCTDENGCGVHIHAGLSCGTNTEQGGHLFAAPITTDPWVDERYSSDSSGNAQFAGVVDIGTTDLSGRAFVGTYVVPLFCIDPHLRRSNRLTLVL